ncbi:MAG: methionyl-tRNA formyltransferase [Firmicutes bacterium]|nr:methionyl-tRNA formyltransferase [Bacillota bacterium]
MKKTRLVFMGTPAFAVPALSALHECCEILAAITQPDKPAGRGRKMTAPPVKVAAQQMGIPVKQPLNLRQREFITWLEALQPHYIVTCAYGKILPPAVLAIPHKAALNIHASLLPRHRGAAPIHRAIMAGDEESGITIMRMDSGMDTGDIVLSQAVPIDSNDTAGLLHDKLAALGAELIIVAIKKINKGTAQFQQQDERLATYAPPLKKDDEKINWCNTSEAIHNQVRGMNPWPGAYTELNGARLKIWEGQPSKQQGHPCGSVLAQSSAGILVATADGSYLITKVQPQGKKIMSADAFLRGRHISLGTVLG